MAITYAQAGVDVSRTDEIKRGFAEHIGAGARVLNGLGPFASLYDISFPEIKEPVLVLKAEEPGSKQKLAAEHGYLHTIGHDMINHLINDIAVMGARPLAVLDTVVCGEADADALQKIIRGISEACNANECALVGGETSVQPQVVAPGVFILTSTVAGIADKSKIIDGGAVREGDAVLAVASNGLHTNGYSLVRALIGREPNILNEKVCGETFLEIIMRPHSAYYTAVKDLFGRGVTSMAHITGGGIAGNLSRVIPDGLCAEINANAIKTPEIFKFIQSKAAVSNGEMLSAFNCGVGMTVTAAPADAENIIAHIKKSYDCYAIGSVVRGTEKVRIK
ncbi:MAG: phosphoribosylformylglycinamidine cyclo-ligase [Defluviitaleaceae bacterium]|nr:phosphoribosylformylglycinamidine cyclo-ligase [Defluviitaleaceae bacterium]